MSGKHTPRPWFVHGDEIEARAAPDGRKYAPVCFIGKDWPEDFVAANLLLIAFAPDLLDALENIVAVDEMTFPTALKKKNAFERAVMDARHCLAHAKGAAK
jgi:hypothetical protein